MEISASSSNQVGGTTSSSTIIPTPVSVNTDTNPSTTQPSVPTTPTEGTNDFKDFLVKALGGASRTEVNEEELFAALLEQKLTGHSAEAGAAFKAEKDKLMVSMARADGYVPVEDVASAALKAVVAAGHIDRAAAEQINGAAFAGAQLDTNLTALYDGRGGPNDPTMAVAKMEEAMRLVDEAMAKIEKGELTAAPRDLDTPSNKAPGAGGADPATGGAIGDPSSAPSGSQKLDGSGGFLWKPESERDGNLVVLLPTELNGLIDRVEVHASLPPTESTKLGEGRFSSIGNGDRSHYRFSKPGEDYGDGAYVVAYRDDGQMVTWQIGNAGERND